MMSPSDPRRPRAFSASEAEIIEPVTTAPASDANDAAQSRPGLPIGLQLLCPPFEEERMLRAARMYEAATDWHTRRPVV